MWWGETVRRWYLQAQVNSGQRRWKTEAGVRPKALQAAMGHSNIRLTMETYADVFELDKDDHAPAYRQQQRRLLRTNVRKMFARPR